MRLLLALAVTILCVSCTRDPAADSTSLDVRVTALSATETAIDAALTALATVPEPTPQPTDCGARIWWNFAGVDAINFMIVATTTADRMNEFDVAPPSDVQAHGLLFLQEQLGNELKAFQQHDYPLCAKNAYDALVSGMFSYDAYFFERRARYDASNTRTPNVQVELQYLQDARLNMQRAAVEIQRLTSENTDFLVTDHIS